MKDKDLLHRELERMSHDEIKVCNPTPHDFEQIVDGRAWIIPNKNRDMGDGKGYRVVPRYVAKLYRTHHLNDMINRADKKLHEKKKSEWTGEMKDFYRKEEDWGLRTSNKTLRKKYGNGKMADGTVYQGLWVSIVRKHGMDVDKREEEQAKGDTRPLDDQLFEDQELPLDEDFIKEISA